MTDRVMQIAEEPDWGSLRGKLLASSRYLARNPSLLMGLALLVALGLFSALGRVFIDVKLAAPLSAPPAQPPGNALLLGSDPQGRNLLAVMIEGTWLTIAPVSLPARSAYCRQCHRLISAYFGGWSTATSLVRGRAADGPGDPVSGDDFRRGADRPPHRHGVDCGGAAATGQQCSQMR